MVGAIRAVTNYFPFTATLTATTATIEWVRTSGVRNMGLRTLDSIAMIADRMGFVIHKKGTLADLINLTKPVKPLFSFFETVTKTIPIYEAWTKPAYKVALRAQATLANQVDRLAYQNLIFVKTGLTITINPRPHEPNFDIVRAGYIPFNLMDRTCAVAYAVTDWLSSYGDWVEYRFRQSASQDAIHWNQRVKPWIGRVFYLTNMWAELRILFANRYRDKMNTRNVQGGLLSGEKVSSYVKIGLYAMFMVLDILGQIKLSPGSSLEKANFWIQRVGLNIGIPLAVIIVPKLFTESLRNQALDV